MGLGSVQINWNCDTKGVFASSSKKAWQKRHLALYQSWCLLIALVVDSGDLTLSDSPHATA